MDAPWGNWMRWLVALLLALSWRAVSGQGLKVYTEISPPAQQLGADGKLTGFTVDLVREIQRRIGNTDPIEVVPWAKGYGELQARPNVALFTAARSQERAELFQWVGPIRELTYQLYVRADSHAILNSLEDARKLKLIGVYKDDVREQYLIQKGFTNLDRSVDNTIIVKKLMAGRIEAFISRPDAVDQILRTAGFAPGAVRGTLALLRLPGYIAFSKTTPARTVKKWDEAFQGMKSDGTYERMFKHYFPHQPFVIPLSR